MAIHEAVLHYVATGDLGLMRKVRRWLPPRWLRLWMVWATRAGDGWLWGAIGLAIALFGDADRWRALEASAASGAAGILLFQCLRRLADRRRPCEIEPHCWAELLPPDRFSFPSGHSLTAFAVSVSLALFFPSLAVALFLAAASVAASRILLGMHFLSDVLAGSVLGATLGYVAFLWLG
ncbi:MAG: phosphatase PAP2 family protein [Bryobacteraceae bacterium]